MDSSLKILLYHEEYRNQILEVWEKSVFATHDFLLLEDFVEIKALVQTIPFQDFQVYFREFNQKLVELYQSKSEKENISDLYPAILAWCQEFEKS